MKFFSICKFLTPFVRIRSRYLWCIYFLWIPRFRNGNNCRRLRIDFAIVRNRFILTFDLFLGILYMALLVFKGVGFNFQGNLCLTSLVLYAKVFPIQSYTMNSSFFSFHLGSVKVYTDTWLIVLVRQQKAKKFQFDAWYFLLKVNWIFYNNRISIRKLFWGFWIVENFDR